MAATAAALRAKLVIREEDRVLRRLTRINQSTNTAVDTTVLDEYCTMAIEWFEVEFGDYDPDNYSIHYTVAGFKAMAMLYTRTHQDADVKKAKWYEDQMAPYMQKLRSARGVGVDGTSERTVDDEPTTKVPFNEDFFDGVLPDVPEGGNY